MEPDGSDGVRDEGAHGIWQTGIRLDSERAVLAVIATNGGISGAGIARSLKLGAQTVSRILLNLERAGLVRRGVLVRGRRGQPATPFYLVPDSAYSFGCEVGWRHLTVLLHDMSGAILARHTESHAYPDPRTLLPRIAGAIGRLVEVLPGRSRHRLAGIGVATPGRLRRFALDRGVPHEIAALWRDFDLHGQVRQITGLEVFAVNDGNAAAWSEYIAHPPPRPRSFFYFLVNTSLATGLLSKGQLWEGDASHGANLGAIYVTDNSGRVVVVGCLASIDALRDRLIQSGIADPGDDPDTWPAEAAGAAADGWVDEAGRALAHAIGNAIAVADVDRAIIDGALPEPLLTRLVEAVRGHLAALPRRSMPLPAAVVGHLGALAPAFGAAQLVLYRKFFARTPGHGPQ
jgi:predicted NBD/HSP70 family sugar kinase